MFGLLNLSVMGYILATIILTQITIAAVTLYLHRCQTHKAISLSPGISHFFRFWLWLTTGMVTADWVAIHRKHHAMTDVEGDPHSPQVLGIKKVLWQGAELYREAAKDTAMVDKYSHGTPKDWLEKNVYSKHATKGIILMLLLNILLFGIPGVSIWALQMIWIPFHAAGVINGIGHYFGYRNYECNDAARNIFPWGFWIGGEELHNNHHTYASSAKFSLKWWEFDLGWFYIKILSFLGLAKVRKLPPKIEVAQGKLKIDIETVRAVISNRFVIMAKYYKNVVRPTLKNEKKLMPQYKDILKKTAKVLKVQEKLISLKTRQRLTKNLQHFANLRKVYAFKQSLQNIWLKSASSQQELIEAIQNWCKQAEESGLDALKVFSLQLRGYVVKI